ncbi:MAG: efflux RND transporter permease subunit [Candidatus Obscuribacter sp.]|nr:efflux RND transporter permease subunit [Candidatus Obscuribacter sp.]
MNTPCRVQYEGLYKTAGEVKERISKLPWSHRYPSESEVDNPEVHAVKIDRDRVAMLGLSMQQVEDALNSAYSARQISTMYTSTNQNWVIIEVEPRYYRGPRALNSPGLDYAYRYRQKERHHDDRLCCGD